MPKRVDEVRFMIERVRLGGNSSSLVASSCASGLGGAGLGGSDEAGVICHVR